MNDKRFDQTSTEELVNVATANFCDLIDMAKDPETSETTLLQLATDKTLIARDANCRLRDALLDNPKISLEALEALANDYCCMYGVSRHQNATIDLIREMLTTYNNDYHIEEELLARLRECKDPCILTKYANDESVSVREAVAGNLNTPKKVRKKLSKDESMLVRMAAES